MRRRIAVLALLASTALTTPAHAGSVSLFLQGVVASFGATATTAAVATAIGGAGAAGFALGSFVFGSALGRVLLSVGLSAVARALQPQPNLPRPGDRNINFAQAVAPMEWAVGTVRKGGPYGVVAFSNERRHYTVILASHEIDGVAGHYLDPRPVLLNNQGEAETQPYTDPANPVIILRNYLGDPAQQADAFLISQIPEWTTAHDMQGLAYISATARRVDQTRTLDIYGSSQPIGPVIAPVFRGAKVYDPRTGTTAWSANAALVWAWITTNRLGAAVDWDDVAAEADVCDRQVMNGDGQTQALWTLNGVGDDTVDYETLQTHIIAACDGYIYERPDGKVGMKVGRWIEPNITLTADDFYSISIAENEWGIEPPTQYVASYVEPLVNWTEQPSGTWVADATALKTVRQEPQLFFVNNHNQAIRCLKRIAAASRPRYRVQGQIGMIGYELIGGKQGGSTAHRFVGVSLHGYDFVMEIGRISRNENLSTFTIEGVSAEAGDFDFNASTEEPTRPERNTPTSDNTVDPPTNVAAVASSATSISVTWDLQSSALLQQVRYREVGTSQYVQSPSLPNQVTGFEITGLTSGVSHEVQARNITPEGRPSVWTSTITV